MLILFIGIVVFLGAHLMPSFPRLRARVISRIGAGPYKGLISVVSLVGFGLICWGFAGYRADGHILVWAPTVWTKRIAAVLMWLAFVSLAFMGKRPSRIRGWLRHPMLVAIKIWALAHLLANGDIGGILLFGSFLAFAVYDRISVKQRGDMGAPPSGFTAMDVIGVVIGTVAYVAMLFLHPILIGISVLGAVS